MPTYPQIIEQGRRTALAVGAGMIVINLAVSGMMLAARGMDGLPRALSRAGLAVLLAVMLYRGHAYARWIMIALIMVNILLGGLMLPGNMAEWAERWPMVVMLVAYIFIGRTLLYSQPLAAYMGSRQADARTRSRPAA